MKPFLLLLLFFIAALLLQPAAAQPRPSDGGKKQAKLVVSFFRYVQAHGPESAHYDRLRKRYLPDHPLDSAGRRTYTFMLRTLHSQIRDMNLKEYRVVPWPDYPFPEKLPRLVDETEPVTHLMGEPVPVPQKPSAEERKKFREAVLVGFPAGHPEDPAFYVLLTPDRNRIRSWLLIRQGDYHYFLTY